MSSINDVKRDAIIFVLGGLALATDSINDLEKKFWEFVLGGGLGGGGGGTPATTVTDETTFGISPIVGILTPYAREDHTHGSPTNPVTVHEAAGDPHPVYLTSVEGNAAYDVLGAVTTHEAASDPHTQYLTAAEGNAAYAPLSGTFPGYGTTTELTDVTKAAESAGISGLVSRADHKHDITTAVAGSSAFGDTAAEGTATTSARSDHKHGREVNPVTAHEAASDPHTGYLKESDFTTKGDVMTATGAGVTSRLGVGSNTQVLTADSTTATGLKWATPSAGGGSLTVVTGQVNFGASTDEDYNAVVTLATPTIAANSNPIAFLIGTATTDHDPEDYIVQSLDAVPMNIVVATSVDVHVSAPDGAFGLYNVGVAF